MADEVVYVKLVNGDEIVGRRGTDASPGLTLVDPLAMETGISEDDPSKRFFLMTRYLPCAATNRVTFRDETVLLVAEANPAIARYYDISLRYCEGMTDRYFQDGIDETTSWMEKRLSGTHEGGVVDGGMTERSRLLWSAVLGMNFSNTAHGWAALLNTAAIGGGLLWADAFLSGLSGVLT